MEDKLCDLAEDIYEEIFNNVGSNLQAGLVISLLEQEKWNDSIDYLRGLIDAYPESALVATSLYTIGTIYQERLNQPRKANDIYQEIIDKYPDSKAAESAKKQVEVIKTAEEE